jgi:SAM-dependent methyltransferase
VAADALAAWRDNLMAWAIPDEILARAPESPWKLPRELFTRRADAQIEWPQGTSLRRAQEALPSGGSVLDVGAGSGAASLPLASRAALLVAVDTDPQMLEELDQRALRLNLRTQLIPGRWPDVAENAPVADVVVCSHVLYNVPDLGPFVEALSNHARRRVVVEITGHHPLAGLNPLWRRFHNLERPARPTWEDAVDAIAALGLQPVAERSRRRDEAAVQGSFAEVVALTRRRLCLPAERDAEIAQALRERGFDPLEPRTWTLRDPELVTIWWARGTG